MSAMNPHLNFFPLLQLFTIYTGVVQPCLEYASHICNDSLTQFSMIKLNILHFVLPTLSQWQIYPTFIMLLHSLCPNAIGTDTTHLFSIRITSPLRRYFNYKPLNTVSSFPLSVLIRGPSLNRYYQSSMQSFNKIWNTVPYLFSRFPITCTPFQTFALDMSAFNLSPWIIIFPPTRGI